MAVALAPEFNQYSSSCAVKVPTLWLELKKCLQNVVLRTVIFHGLCGVNAIKLDVLGTKFQEL